ncbi:MAG: squalene/phytoene synthase family protein [Chloroflexi bacterium]|nr:squalene/phytoene synthase family protein [Chloroflexota bacterium]
MVAQTRTWEGHLLSLAGEAWQMGTAVSPEPVAEEKLLKDAYAYCQEITAEHSRSFYIASSLLPEEKRQAVRALYAFCRITDDIVDNPEGNVAANLTQWQRHAFSNTPPPDDLPALAWADARQRYQIPARYAEQLVEGVSRDLDQDRYRNLH